MSRKHYNALAKAVRAMQDQIAYNAYAYLIGTVGNTLAEDNPRFNHDKWWDACMDGYNRDNQGE